MASPCAASTGRTSLACLWWRPMRIRPAWCWPKGGVEDKAGESSVAPSVLAQLDLHDKVVTGDALYAQQALCRQIVAAGGDYFFFLKGNQATLHEDVALLFAEPPTSPACSREHTSHGHRHEVRCLEASAELNEYSGWPHLGQVCRLTRVATVTGVR